MTTTNYQGAVKAGRPLSPLEKQTRCHDLRGQLRRLVAGYETPAASAAVQRIVAELAEHAKDPQVPNRVARPNCELVFVHPFGSPAYVRKFGKPVVETPAAPSKKRVKKDG